LCRFVERIGSHKISKNLPIRNSPNSNKGVYNIGFDANIPRTVCEIRRRRKLTQSIGLRRFIDACMTTSDNYSFCRFFSRPATNRNYSVRQRFDFKVTTLVHRAMGTLPATWLTTAVTSPTLAQEDCVRLRLECISSVGRGPTSVTESSVQLDLESGTICRRTPGSQTCHIAVSDSR